MEEIIKECREEYDGIAYYKFKHLLYLIGDENKYDEYKNEVYDIEEIEYVNQKTFYNILLNSEKMCDEMIKLLCNVNLFSDENQNKCDIKIIPIKEISKIKSNVQKEYEIEINKMHQEYMLIYQKEKKRHEEVMKRHEEEISHQKEEMMNKLIKLEEMRNKLIELKTLKHK